VQWASLLSLSIALVVVLEAVRLPAAMLLGTMVAAIVVSIAGATVRVPDRPFFAAQAVLGCLIARSIPLSFLAELLRNWPLFLAVIVSVIVASASLGWLLTRWRVLPGTCAIWGSAPGAATAMVLMAEAHGADIRLVAIMQYLRVVCVAVVASLVSRLWVVTGPAAPHPGIEWFPPIAWTSFVGTLALAGCGAVIARRLRVPAGPLLLPLTAGVILQGGGWLRIDLPPWLLAISYAFIGWSIGLRFTRPILAHAARALPRILASILALIALCGGFAALLATVAGIDPLTAYLATSPGGADTVAIIAASSHVDVAFVMTMQTGRFLVVLLTGPSLARFIAGRVRIAEERP
jgi:membrane AbrB-like protein